MITKSTVCTLLGLILSSSIQLSGADIKASATNTLRGGNYVDNVLDNSLTASARGSSPRKGMLKFDMSVVELESGTNAILNLFNIEAPDGLNIDPLEVGIYALPTDFTPDVGELGYDWDPSLLTWNNAPGHNTESNLGFGAFGISMTRVGTMMLTKADPLGNQYTIEIENIAQWIQPDQTITLALAFEAMDINQLKLGTYDSDEFPQYAPYLSVSGTITVIYWAGYSANPDTFVADTGGFLGNVDIEFAPFIWVENMENFIYVEESAVSEAGAWVFIHSENEADLEQVGFEDETVVGFTYSHSLNSFLYSSNDSAEANGKWYYVFKSNGL